jgi:hypothetical protein
MKSKSSRRSFLTAGLALPAAALASAPLPVTRQQQKAPASPAGRSVELRYRTLGKTGLKVTSLGFGCMITSDPSVIERAADIGITYFDTARGYQGGNNERMVGAVLKAKRKNIYLSSKQNQGTKAGALANLETSLNELGTDYLDVWLLHGAGSAAAITDEWLEAATQAKKDGKVRFYGLSCHSRHDEVIPAAIAKKLEVIQISYNFTMDPPIDPLLEQAGKAGLGVVAMKVMAGGLRRLKPGAKGYEALNSGQGYLPALKWALRNQNVNTTVPSITDMDQLDQNLKAMASPYTDADGKILAQLLEEIRPLYCRMCGRCTGTCPKGLPVADMLRFLTYAEGYGQYPLGREHFLALGEEITSVRCRDCASCAVKCPNGVRVAERLIHAQELFA